ncbi:MAG: ATP-NAD kinase family protein [Eubacteriales bacterium]
MKKLGVIINPIAGLGGSVGLKGTDNMIEEALLRGAMPHAEERMKQALLELQSLKQEMIVYTGAGSLGANISQELGYTCVLEGTIDSQYLTADNSKKLCAWLQKKEVDVILFAGGDGTARDLYEVANEKTVFLGVPAGVKIHSPVYARSAISAGRVTAKYLSQKNGKTCEAEVLDIDEVLYRKEIINTKLYGYLRIPNDEKNMQSRKSPTPLSEEAVIESIAARMIDNMENDTTYIIGAGTTTRAIMKRLELTNTLIGVDIIRNKRLVKNDVYNTQILDCIGETNAKLIITVTGGQGFLLGRGNQQITPSVIRKIGKDNIIIIATKEKLLQLKGRSLYVDTGDLELDKSLCGYYKVITSNYEEVVYQVSC